VELVRRGLAETREQAQAFISDGRVRVAGGVADKASRLVAPADAVVVAADRPRFVSRGGDKLDAALAQFDVAVAGRRALDAGASTGGFTDCLLQRGAAAVVAVDVGRGQLHPRVAGDPRVRILDRTNLRHLKVGATGGAPFEVVVADLSFISLRTVAPVLAGELAGPGADLVVLVKPQFEAGRAEASRTKGVIRDPQVWLAAVEGVASALTGAGAAIMGAMVSPLRGAEGNVEFFLHARAGTTPSAGPDLAAVVAAVESL
jgi:23S rRNA (cytidine1920-2'-O)/16S rRNA (cytidine1409-2'-O)-methyltransferase